MSTEVEVAGDVVVAPSDFAGRLEAAHAAERRLWRRIVWSTLVLTPICVVVWVGLAAVALALADSGNYLVELPVAGGIGIIAGQFFGMWWAFLRSADEFDELDRGVERRPAS
jgi:hypothetical protein